MTKKLTPYDPAGALVDNEDIAFFMADAGYVAKALGVLARATGFSFPR